MRKLAKAVLGVALLSGVVLAHPVKPVAKHEAKTEEKLGIVKARIINMINKKIDFLQRQKICIERVRDWKELRTCRSQRILHRHRATM